MDLKVQKINEKNNIIKKLENQYAYQKKIKDRAEFIVESLKGDIESLKQQMNNMDPKKIKNDDKIVQMTKSLILNINNQEKYKKLLLYLIKKDNSVLVAIYKDMIKAKIEKELKKRLKEESGKYEYILAIIYAHKKNNVSMNKLNKISLITSRNKRIHYDENGLFR